MVATFLIIASSFFGKELKQIPIEDMVIRKALVSFVDSTKQANFLATAKYNIVVRVEANGSSRFVYIGAVAIIDEFKLYGIPDAYSLFEGRLIFWYKNKSDEESYDAFAEQFHTVDGEKYWTEDRFFEFDGRAFRYSVDDSEILEVRRVCRFPGKNFYKSGYRFDKNGDLMFNDGSYDLCDLLNSSPGFNPYKFELASYFDSLEVKIDSLSDLKAQIVIRKNGKVKSVRVSDDNFELSEDKRKYYESLILKMPPWNKAKLRKKRIAYKLFIGL